MSGCCCNVDTIGGQGGGGGVVVCDSTPTGVVAGSAGAVGTDTDASRCDHEHPVPVAAPVATGTANAAGGASTLVRSDHVHETALAARDEGVPVGSGHTMNFVGAGVVAAAGAGVITVTIPGGGGVALCDAAPTGITAGSGGAPGIAVDASRCDHDHPVAVASPVATGTANAPGAAGTLVRSDHVHETAVRIQDEGVPGGTAHTINFVGAGVAAAVAAGIATVAIPGGGGGGSGAPIMWGSESVGVSRTTRYLDPGYSDHLARPSLAAGPRWQAPRPGTLRNLYVNVGGTSADTDPIVHTVLVNGVAPAGTLAVSIPGNVATASDLVNTVAVAAGDFVDLRVTKASFVIPGVTEIVAVMEFV